MKLCGTLMALAGLIFLTDFALAVERPDREAHADGHRQIRITGSTTAAPIARSFADSYAGKHPDVRVKISAIGTEKAPQALVAKKCDIALMSRFMKPAEFKAAVKNGVEPVFHPIATDAIAVIVNPENPISNLTMDQLQGIYGGLIANWKEVGGRDLKIRVLNREENSGTRAIFSNTVMKGDSFRKCTLVRGNAHMRDVVADNPAAVGYVGSGFLQGVRPISIDKIAPTFQTIRNGTYPLARPLFMVTDGYPKPGSHLHHLTSMPRTVQGQRIVASMDRYDSWVGRIKGHEVEPDAQLIKVGVLAKRGEVRCRKRWLPTVNYLSRTIPAYRFELVPLKFEEVFPAVKDGSIDFILANPSYYVQMATLYRVSRVATMKNRRLGKGYDEFGSVVFCRADRKNIRSLGDLNGKKFMAVDTNSFGGWQMAWRKMKSQGINPHEDFAELTFGGTHDAVIHAVEDGRVDAGTVRTDTLERMAEEGKVRLADFRVLDGHTDPDTFPFRHSTGLYPEWPMAALAHVPESLAREVAAALLTMPPASDVAKAAKCAGWTVPLNYQPVRECLQTLKIGPYATHGEVTWQQTVKEYWPFITAGLVVLTVSLLVATYVSRLNLRLRETVAEKEREVTERKRAEAALSKNEQKFREIFNNAHDAIYLHEVRDDAQPGQFLEVNQVATKMLGYTRDEFLQMSPQDIDAETHKEDSSEAVSTLLEDGHVTFEMEHVAKDGSRVPVEISSHYFKMGGEPRILSVARDISERKRAEEALRQSEQRFRHLAELLPETVFEMDKEGNLTFVNRRGLDIFGYTQEDVEAGLNAFDMFVPAERGRALENAGRILNGEDQGGVEYTMRRKDDTTFPVLVYALPIVRNDRTVGLRGIVVDLTQRKRAEERYRTLFESSRDAIVTGKLGSRKFSRGNPAARKLFEIPEEMDFSAVGPVDLSPESQPDGTPSAEGVQRAIRKAIQDGAHFFEWRHKTFNGREFDASVQLTRVRIAGETVIQGTVRDITARKRAEEALRKSEKKYRELVQSARVIILRMDTRGNVTFFNDFAQYFFGYSEDEILGENVVGTIVPEKDAAGRDLRAMISDILSNPHEYTTNENENICKDGERVWVSWTNRPILDDQGQVSEVLCVGIDVTRRKKAQEELLHREERLQMALMGGELGTWDWNLSTGKVEFDERWARMKGYNLEELEPRVETWEKLVHPDDLSRARRKLNDHLYGETDLYEAEFRMKHKAGGWVWILDKGKVTARDIHGNPLRACGTHQDITERKKAQEKLEEVNAELKRSNKDLQEFTYTVSHDLQAPLRKIYTFGQFLEEDCADELPEEGREHLHRMQAAAVRMKELIQHLLKLSRVKTRGAELEPVEPRVVLEQVNEDLSEEIADSDAEVTMKEDLPTVLADEVQLRQVFQNLISNALKFRSPDRKPRVTVSAQRNGRYATFSVADNGIGIEEDYREKIFGIFKRLNRREEYEGAGVGLALCAKIVRRHGGRIWVESEPNEGSEFKFTLAAC